FSRSWISSIWSAGGMRRRRRRPAPTRRRRGRCTRPGCGWPGRDRSSRSWRGARARRRGKPPPGGQEDGPRPVLQDAVGYVLNNRDKMDYPAYRRLGLPISSAPVESTIKQVNRRVKGTEKFWLEGGAEAVLQLRAAYLSEDDRAQRYWLRP